MVALVTMPSESGKEVRWSHGQECSHRHNAYRRSDGEVGAGHEMRADAISDQEIEDDHIEQVRDQARRVGVASNGPIHMDGSRVGDESSHPDEWQNDKVATKTVKKQIADRNRSNSPGVNPILVQVSTIGNGIAPSGTAASPREEWTAFRRSEG